MHVSQMTARTVLGAVVMSALVVGNARAADRFVSTTGSDAANDCLSSVSPCRTVGYALTQTASGDTIKVAVGTYRENVVIDYSTTLTLSGGWSTGFTSRDPAVNLTRIGGDASRVLSCEAGFGEAVTVTLDGLVIRQGGDGGVRATSLDDGSLSLTLQSCTITRNRVRGGDGGGILATASGTSSLSLTITGCAISKNRALSSLGAESAGGGLWLLARDSSSLNLDLSDSSVTGNVANHGEGGGLGAIVADAAHVNLAVTNVAFTGNQARSGNNVDGAGGGMATNGLYASTGTVDAVVTNSTFTNNRAGLWGGGLSLRQVSGTVTLRNDILWGNRAANYRPDFQDAHTYGTGSIDHSDIGSGIESFNDLGGNISLDPLFVRANDVHLTAGSPCIDTGTCAGAPTTDIDGDPRPTGAGCDMGADEFVP